MIVILEPCAGRLRQREHYSTWSGGLHTYACAKIDKMRKNQICLHNNI